MSSDFDETWPANRGWSKIITGVYWAAPGALTVGKTGCQSGKNSFFPKSSDLSPLGHFYQPDAPLYHEIC